MNTHTHKFSRNRSRGFTLIETLLATGIVGTLSAIAIPAYQDYVARSEVVEVVSGMSAAKTSITASVATTGRIPDTLSAPFSQGGSVDAVAVYRYQNCPDRGGIEVRMGSTSVSPSLQGKTVRLQYQGNGRWDCSQGASAGIPGSLLPKACRSAAEAIPEGCGSIEYSTLTMSNVNDDSNSFGDSNWTSGYGGANSTAANSSDSADYDADEFEETTLEWEQPVAASTGSGSSDNGGTSSSSGSTTTVASGGGNDTGSNNSCQEEFGGANETGSNDAMLSAESECEAEA